MSKPVLLRTDWAKTVKWETSITAAVKRIWVARRALKDLMGWIICDQLNSRVLQICMIWIAATLMVRTVRTAKKRKLITHKSVNSKSNVNPAPLYIIWLSKPQLQNNPTSAFHQLDRIFSLQKISTSINHTYKLIIHANYLNPRPANNFFQTL